MRKSAATQRSRLNLAIVFCFAFIAACSACTTGTYTQLSSLGGTAPTSITGHTLNGYSGNNKLYVFGGTDNSYSTTPTYYNKLSSFDTTTQTWSTLSTSGGPSPRAYHGAAISTYGGTPTLLVSGGYYSVSGGRSLYKELWSWNINSGGWTQLANAPKSAQSPGFVYYNGYAYSFGGLYDLRNYYSNALTAYNVATNTWTTLTAQGAAGSPSSRMNPHMFVSGGNIYVHGGNKMLPGPVPNLPVPLSDTWMYNLTSNTWTNITPSSGNNMLPPSAYPSYGASGNTVVLFGGDTGAAVNGITGCGAPYPQQVSDDTWIGTISGSTVTYAQQTPGASPPPSTQGAGTTIGNCFYKLGGFDFPSCPPGQVWNNEVYTYGF